MAPRADWVAAPLTLLMAVVYWLRIRALRRRMPIQPPMIPHPSPHIPTPRDAEQYLAAGRDTSPAYFDRYVLDKSHRPIEVQQAAVDRIHWFSH
jgi:hypothetical protein